MTDTIQMGLIVIAIALIYLRTYKYKYLIDDHVERSGMYDPEMIPPPPVPVVNGVRFDDRQQSVMTTVTNIGVYTGVCCVIYLLWGWKVALLYAVMPLNVSGASWRTGNMYMSSAFLILVAYYLLRNGGIIIPYFLFFGALHSTISSLGFIAIALCYPMGWVMGIPLLIFLTGDRFTKGLRKRKEAHEEKGMMSARIHWSNIIVAINCMAYYVCLTLGFTGEKLAFFHTFGHEGQLDKPNRHALLSLILLLVFIYFGMTYNPQALFWWFMFMGVFCNIVPNLNQFVSERYTYIANIAVCWLYVSCFPEQMYWVLVGVWFMISHRYVKAYRSNEALFSHGTTAFPMCPSNYGNLGGFYMDRGMHQRAIAPLECALKLGKGNKAKVHGNLALCYAVWAQKSGFRDLYKRAHNHCVLALKNCDLDAIPTLETLKKKILKRITKRK